MGQVPLSLLMQVVEELVPKVPVVAVFQVPLSYRPTLLTGTLPTCAADVLLRCSATFGCGGQHDTWRTTLFSSSTLRTRVRPEAAWRHGFWRAFGPAAGRLARSLSPLGRRRTPRLGEAEKKEMG